MPAIPGQNLSHYSLIQKLGEGGMGVIFKARDEKLGRLVALKVLPPHLTNSPERRARLLHEARAAASINHPNIATVYEVDEAEGLVFFAMELVEGMPLRTAIDAGRPPVSEALRMGAEIAAGLARAHQVQVVHRDLKPENIALTLEGQVKILDFGLARILHGGVEGSALAQTEPTQTESVAGTVTGTAAYMSPEQARGQLVDHRSDIFSFGIVLYELLTGKNPFRRQTHVDSLAAIVDSKPAPASQSNQDVPQELDRIVGKCLEKNPSERYQDAADLAVDLRHLRRDTDTAMALPAHARSAPLWTRPAFLGMLALGAVVLVLGVTLVARWEIGIPAAKAEENALAVAAFENIKNPDDPERLGQILQELAITDLSELGSLKVFSSQRLKDAERQVRHGKKGGSAREQALQIAARVGARTLLTGTLSQLGATWVLTGQLVDVAKGTVITSARVDGGDLYSMIDDLTRRIRDDLRVRMADRGAVNLPVRQKTTQSLEAYRHFLAGSDLLNAWDYDAAVAEFRKAVAVDSTFSQAQYKLAIAAWWANDDIDAAREPLSRLLSGSFGASSRDRLMAEGALALIGGCYEIAQQKFERVTRDHADEKEAWYGLGEAWFHGRGDLAKAREAFGRAVALDPDFTVGSIHLADIERMEGRLDAARQVLDRLIRAKRESPQLSGSRVALEIHAGDEAAARSALADALRRQPTAAAKRALCLIVAETFLRWESPDPAKAREVAMRALSFEPVTKDPRIYVMLARIAGEQNHAAEEERWLLKGMEFAPNDRHLVQQLGYTYGERGRFREIVSMARRAIEKDPVGARAWYLCRAGAAAASGDSAEIATAIPAALALERDSYSVRDASLQLAWAFQNTGQHKRAEEFSRKALNAVPECENPWTYNVLGWSLLRQGNVNEAEVVFQRGLTLSPQGGALQNGLLTTFEEAGKHRESLDLAKRMCWEQPQSPSTNALHRWVYAAASLDAPAEVDSALAFAARVPGAQGRGSLLASAGSAYQRVGNYQVAIGYFRAAMPILSRRGNTEAEDGLGSCFESMGRYAEAERWYRKSLAVNGEGGAALYGLITVLLDQRRYKEAEAMAERYGRLSPGGRWRAVDLQIRAGKQSEADRLLERVFSETQSTDARRVLLARLVGVYFQCGDVTRARALRDRAARLGPPDATQVNERYAQGYVALGERNFTAAESAFARCRDANADRSMAVFYLSLAKVLRGDLRGAEAELRAQIERKPAYYLHYSLLSVLLAQAGRYGDAVPFAERAAAMDSSRNSLTLLAWALVSGGSDPSRAEALARRALGAPSRPIRASNLVYPFTPSLEQTLGRAAMKRGDYRAAVHHLEGAARLRPDRPSIQTDLKEARRALAEATRARGAS